MKSLTWLDVDLNAVRNNVRTCLERCGVPIMAVVKADAYGLGAIEIARAEEQAGVDYFAVARMSEAMSLRDAGIGTNILVFNAFGDEEIDTALQNDLTLSLNSLAMAERIIQRCELIRKTCRIHLKIDSGMGRFGFLNSEISAVLDLLTGSNLEIEGIYSHYALIDDDPNASFNTVQKQRFDEALTLLTQRGITPKWVHFSNSAAALSTPQTRYSMVRMGSALLGMNPFYYDDFPSYLQRVISWRSQLVSLRRLPVGSGLGYSQSYHLTQDSFVGIIPAGYGDGFQRNPHNEVIIAGKKYPIVGKVCSDVCMVLPDQAFTEGQEVVLLGKQGETEITLEDLAERWSISRAAVSCGITQRVDRIYL